MIKIYHIMLPERWEEVRESESYTAESLFTEGFIHCSFPDQLEGVIKRYFVDADQVVILEIDTGKLTSKLVSEPSTNGEPYPHIYGEINARSVIRSQYRKLAD